MFKIIKIANYRFFILSLVIIGLILNSFNVIVNSQEINIILVDNENIYDMYGFSNLTNKPIYRQENLIDFDLPLIIERTGILFDIKKRDISFRFANIKNNETFNERFRTIDFDILGKNDNYIAVNFNMKCYAGKEFSVDLIPKFKDIEFPNFAWWNSSWHNFVMITINPSFINENLVNFPLLVNISDSIGDKSDESRSCVFVDITNSTLYKHEIDTWVDNNERLVWVKIPYIYSNQNTYFLMYYNNSDASSSESPNDVWDNNYVLVWHMTGSSWEEIKDSTNNNNDASTEYNNPSYNDSGKIGKSVNMNSDSSLQFEDVPVLDFGVADLTISCWSRGIVDENLNVLWCLGYSVNPNPRLVFYIRDDSPYEYAFMHDGTDYILNTYNQNLTGSNYYSYWSHIRIGAIGYLYHNASFLSSDTQVLGSLSSDKPRHLGAINDSSGTRKFWNGNIDEFRISNIARNTSWLYLDYHSCNLTQSLLSWGIPYQNYPPVLSVSYVYNQSVDVELKPNLQVWCNDSDGNTLDLSWSENSSGVWKFRQYNSSISANSTHYFYFNTANTQNKKYWWRCHLQDDFLNISWIFEFTTKSNVSVNITFNISLIYPLNNSINSSLQPIVLVYLYHESRSLMNISFYIGYNLSTCNYLIKSLSNINFGIFNFTFINCTVWNYQYYFRISINDGTNFSNSTYKFNTINIGGVNMSNVELSAIEINAEQFYIMIILIVWILVTKNNFDDIQYRIPDKFMAYIQLLLTMPLFIYFANVSYVQNLLYGWAFTLSLVIVSVYIITAKSFNRWERNMPD